MLFRTMAVALMSVAVAACAGNPFSTSGPPPSSSTMAAGPPPAPPPAMAPGPQAGGDPAAERTVSPAVAGAAIGRMIGNIGAALDDDDKQHAYAAQIQALESGGPGAPVAWRNPDSGHYGSIVPGPPYDRSGAKCRQYTHTIYIESKPQTARGAACRNTNGSWIPAG